MRKPHIGEHIVCNGKYYVVRRSDYRHNTCIVESCQLQERHSIGFNNLQWNGINWRTEKLNSDTQVNLQKKTS